jgi:hypothetical protein
MAKTDFYIVVRKKLSRDGRVLKLSRVCHEKRVTVLGALVELWILADEYAEEDGHMPGYSPDDIDAFVQIEGFCKSLPEEWCEIREDQVYLPNYQQFNGTTAKTRIENASRQRHARDKLLSQKTCDRSSETSRETRDPEEKRREDIEESSNEDSFVAKRASSPPSGGSEYYFPIKGGQIWTLPLKKLDQYQANYGDRVDLDGEFRKAKQWLIDHTDRRKTASGMPRFLTGWLNKAYDSRHRTMDGSRVAAKPNDQAVFNPETGEIVQPME